MSDYNPENTASNGFQLSRDDYPEEKPHGEFTVDKDTDDGELHVDIEFRDGTIHVNGSGAQSFAKMANTEKQDGQHVLDCGRTRLDGEQLNLYIGIPEEMYRELRRLELEWQDWEMDADRWLESRPLRFKVEEHEYKTGTWRTKYRHEDVVLKPNKREKDMGNEQKWLVDAMKEEFGTADGYPEAPDALDAEEGEIVHPDDVSELVDETLEAIREREAERQEWESLLEEHPELQGLKQVTSDEVKEAFKTAKEERERVEVGKKTTGCSRPSYECDIDLVHVYVTPDAEVETERTHTH